MIIPYERRQAWSKSLFNYLPNKEVWVFYPYSERILVSNMGNFKSVNTNKILKTHKNQQNYHMINVKFSNGTRRSCMAHRLILESFYPILGKDTALYEVNHIDGNKSNNVLSNLEWVTRQENLDHARKNKLFKQSKKILTDQDKFDIVEFRKLGIKCRDLSQYYKVSERYISFISKEFNRD